ncbi:MAG: hypothetical protein R3A10_00020 [Caldilineaceae bacterium]
MRAACGQDGQAGIVAGRPARCKVRLGVAGRRDQVAEGRQILLVGMEVDLRERPRPWSLMR